MSETWNKAKETKAGFAKKYLALYTLYNTVYTSPVDTYRIRCRGSAGQGEASPMLSSVLFYARNDNGAFGLSHFHDAKS